MLKLLKIVKHFIERVERYIESRNETSRETSKFVDLAPTDKADEKGVYSEALFFAIRSPNITNIAITGPYGSGKSSIIRTFLKRYDKPTLNISLAAFSPEKPESESNSGNSDTNGTVTKQEIERSILQQMLYGADANKLPLSRFKRIQYTGKWSLLVPVYIMIGVFSCWHIFEKREKILTLTNLLNFQSSKIPDFIALAFCALFVWSVVYQLYVRSMGVSLKSISLKDIELTPETAKEESILNRHLDEIIYFFQSTKYALVVIEDLDRFNKPDIFVTLREINSLINANSGVKRAVRFLYAIRDNMFENTERTKFFEFIVPVIPIINASNSIDKILEHGRRISIYDRLNKEFLREVSRYLNDLRLIQNIFNEYNIYVSNLESYGEPLLDPNKLLAVLIYKNILPNDFEELHKGKGKLSDILSRHDDLISKVEAECRGKIAYLEAQILAADAQVPTDLQELRAIYAYGLIKRIPSHFSTIALNGQGDISFSDIASHTAFDQIVEAQNIQARNPQYGGGYNHVSIAGFQNDVDPSKNYQQRKAEIERRSNSFKEDASKKIKELREKISGLRLSKFKDIIREDLKDFEDIFDSFGEDKNLARYLVLEGHLDDTYYQYTSLFHSGRLSPYDNKFLIHIRGFTNPDPEFQIDNPAEVIAAMRDEDFRQNYVLNKTLVDYMLGNPTKYTAQISKLLEFIAQNFNECDAFFAAYYERGARVAELLKALYVQWSGFVLAVVASRTALSHVGQLIAHLPINALASLTRKEALFSEFVSKRLAEVLALGIDFDAARIKAIAPEIENLSGMEVYAGVYRVVVNEGLFKLSVENFDSIFRCVLGVQDLPTAHTKHYSTILASGNTLLIERIERDFEAYLTDVILLIDENSKEEVNAIEAVLNQDEVDLAHIESFIEKQAARVQLLDHVDSRVYALLFKYQRVEPTWENCLVFLVSDDFDPAVLASFIQENYPMQQLSAEVMSAAEAMEPLREFITENDGLRDDAYRAYVRMLPEALKKFPTGLGAGKIKILIEEAKVRYSVESHNALNELPDLQIRFIAKNFSLYAALTSEISISDDLREGLLNTEIGDEQKVQVIEGMDVSEFASFPARAAAIGPILNRSKLNIKGLTPEGAQAIIIRSKPISVQISLFNRLHRHLDDGQVRATLQNLPKPLNDIKAGYARPILENTPANTEFCKWLKDRKIISSIGKAIFSDDIVINNFRS